MMLLQVMMRLPHRYKVYNVVHKATVYSLLGGTLLGVGLLGIQGYYYYKSKIIKEIYVYLLYNVVIPN